MQRKQETCSQTIKQWWHEPHVLPSELSKVTIPRMCSLNTQNNDLWTFLDHIGTRKLPCPAWRRSWWWKYDVYSRKTKFFSPWPLFLWLWNCSSQFSEQLSLACPLESLLSILYYEIHFLSITLSLTKFFLGQDKGTWASVSPDTRWMVLIKRQWVQVPS